MSDVSGALVGGVLGDIDTVTTRLAAAGDATTIHATSATATAQQLVDGVADVTARMTTEYQRLAEELRMAIRSAHESLLSADWSGRSRGAADAAEAELGAQVEATLSEATVGVDQLTGTLQQMVTMFHGEVAGRFASVLAQIDERYRLLGRGTASFADGLRELDGTISFG